jgi:hypothetical protein
MFMFHVIPSRHFIRKGEESNFYFVGFKYRFWFVLKQLGAAHCNMKHIFELVRSGYVIEILYFIGSSY